jgi:hypothetical protein
MMSSSTFWLAYRSALRPARSIDADSFIWQR